MLTQNVHLAPNTQQAEQAGFTRAKSHETCQSIFPENEQKRKQLDTKAWNLPGGTRQFHIYGYKAK
jgi:hypothetical protein